MAAMGGIEFSQRDSVGLTLALTPRGEVKLWNAFGSLLISNLMQRYADAKWRPTTAIFSEHPL